MSAIPADFENHVIVQEWAHAERRRRRSRMRQINGVELACIGAGEPRDAESHRPPDCGRVGFIYGALPAVLQQACPHLLGTCHD
jgi:hypothetical protein